MNKNEWREKTEGSPPEPEYAPEPWSAEDRRTSGWPWIIGTNLDSPTAFGIIGLVGGSGNAARIVACVNACKGVSNETLRAVARGEAIVILGQQQSAP